MKCIYFPATWCSHGRGVQYFTESIFSPLAFPSCRCETFEKYIRGECPCTLEDTAYMGEHLSRNTYEKIPLNPLSLMGFFSFVTNNINNLVYKCCFLFLFYFLFLQDSWDISACDKTQASIWSWNSSQFDDHGG